MVKNKFIYQKENTENSGSVEFQVLKLTTNIKKLTLHLELHKKDYSSQRGLIKILGKRQRLFAYLSKINREHYKKLIVELDIRDIKIS
uniref:Small ribosomal subunit protein uS15c n=1 Tax=Aphyllon uniflorum var. occidentale TaxID=1873190 RepID=A0A385Y477_9LAMI|nr:ribosomal protein S15 [Aphyllon uniflorum var. occidentale]